MSCPIPVFRTRSHAVVADIAIMACRQAELALMTSKSNAAGEHLAAVSQSKHELAEALQVCGMVLKAIASLQCYSDAVPGGRKTRSCCVQRALPMRSTALPLTNCGTS